MDFKNVNKQLLKQLSKKFYIPLLASRLLREVKKPDYIIPCAIINTKKIIKFNEKVIKKIFFFLQYKEAITYIPKRKNNIILSYVLCIMYKLIGLFKIITVIIV